ncbi:hypothetical protein PAEPH01_1774 [Pancytospora epiphaga]|nr:hypothetical protein PAEPH01_1774 [Pancytospora epiphaga]
MNLLRVIKLFLYLAGLSYVFLLSTVFYIVIGCLNLGLNKIGHPNTLRVPSVILCYHSVPCHHIRYNVNVHSAPVFFSKLIYNCTCASSLPLILLVVSNL